MAQLTSYQPTVGIVFLLTLSLREKANFLENFLEKVVSKYSRRGVKYSKKSRTPSFEKNQKKNLKLCMFYNSKTHSTVV